MKKIVISQPMFLPWYGLFEQIRMSSVYIHYDDVQFPLGRSFMNRVQIVTNSGIEWLTAPVKRQGKEIINKVYFDESFNWREKHLKKIQRNYKKAKYFDEMFQLILQIYKNETSLISDFNICAIETLANYLGLDPTTYISSNLNVNEKSSLKLLDIIQKLKGTHYLTGHGAKNYLDHKLFENNSVAIEYMDYKCSNYQQLWGKEFTQYVSIIDMIAHFGNNSIINMKSKTINWQDYIYQK